MAIVKVEKTAEQVVEQCAHAMDMLYASFEASRGNNEASSSIAGLHYREARSEAKKFLRKYEVAAA